MIMYLMNLTENFYIKIKQNIILEVFTLKVCGEHLNKWCSIYGEHLHFLITRQLGGQDFKSYLPGKNKLQP